MAKSQRRGNRGSAQAEGGQAARRGAGSPFAVKGRVGRHQPAKTQGLRQASSTKETTRGFAARLLCRGSAARRRREHFDPPLMKKTFPVSPPSRSSELRRCRTFLPCRRPAAPIRCSSSMQTNAPRPSKPIPATRQTRRHASEFNHAISRSNCRQRPVDARRRDGRPRFLRLRGLPAGRGASSSAPERSASLPPTSRPSSVGPASSSSPTTAGCSICGSPIRSCARQTMSPQVEVTGDLPGSPAEWRGGSTAAPGPRGVRA